MSHGMGAETGEVVRGKAFPLDGGIEGIAAIGIAALAVKIDSRGPAFFRQRRIGLQLDRSR